MQLSSGMVYLLLFNVSSCIQISVIKLVVNRAIYFTMFVLFPSDSLMIFASVCTTNK